MPTLSDPPVDLLAEAPLLIGGARIAKTSCGDVEHIYAVTGRPTVPVPLAGRVEVDMAISAARAAAPTWTALRPEGRRDCLLRLTALLREHDSELTALAIMETGTRARHFGLLAAETLAYNAGWCDKVDGTVVSAGTGRGFDFTKAEPYGVVGVIIPWNAPLLTLTSVVAPALAAGNVCIVKTSELAPFSAIRFGELCLAAGLPAGTVNVLAGATEAGEALVEHPGTDKIHFTGSAATGKLVAARAAGQLTPVALELGGKSANIIFADGNVERGCKVALSACLGLSGQSCTAGARILAERAVYEKVTHLLGDLMGAVAVGDPVDDRTDLGPVISAAALDRILGMVGRSTASGEASLAAGGARLEGDLAAGFFLRPTLLTNVDPSAEIAQEEIFGPVLTVTPFDTEEEAIALANGNVYGLAAYVQTAEIGRAHRVASALDVGMIYVNGGLRAQSPAAPFGGTKWSGYGRLGGRVGIEEFVQHKNVWMGG
jgi:aldehyde dehydrogenase (NAD+)